MNEERHFSPDSIIYHGGCYDGFTCAWLCWRAFGDIEFLPAVYGRDLPEPTGRRVLMVDFSYPRERLEEMAAKLDRFLVLDHHKTAQEALAGLAFAEFDMGRAGCQMVFDWLGANGKGEAIEGTRWLVDHVADRDLWKMELKGTSWVHAYYSSCEMSFAGWEGLAGQELGRVLELGAAIRLSIERYCEKVGAEAVETSTEWGDVLVVNAPYINASELASWLLDRGPCPWSVAWFQRGDGKFQYSLRGREVDVSVIAKSFGGGGHAGAAGFDSPSPPWVLWPQDDGQP